MITTAAFLKASPAQKETMISDGLAFVALQMEELERNARVLTGWMANYPDMVRYESARMESPMELITSAAYFNKRMDELTAQFVNASLAHKQLLEYARQKLTKKQLQP